MTEEKFDEIKKVKDDIDRISLNVYHLNNCLCAFYKDGKHYDEYALNLGEDEEHCTNFVRLDIPDLEDLLCQQEEKLNALDKKFESF